MKILIIGQAPPAIKQMTPYDTTLLYDMLSWVGIDKTQAQSMFDFEAISNKFPGFDPKGGHLKPSQEDCESHWINTLEAKMQLAKKVIVLGKVAAKYIDSVPKTWSCDLNIIELPHPSKRNYSLIMKNKAGIVKKLSDLVTNQ